MSVPATPEPPVDDAAIVVDETAVSNEGETNGPTSPPVDNSTAPSPAAAGTPAPDGDDEAGAEAEAEGGNNEDEYIPATETTEARIPSFKKRTPAPGDNVEGAVDDDDDEDAEEDEARRRRKKKKREQRRAERAAEDEEEQEQPVDAAAARRQAIEDRIEAIGKKQRVNRKKKKDGEGVDIVDTYHDELCIRLRDRMMAAAAKDIEANNNKLPATSKLAMLDEVYRSLQNTTLWSSIIDNEVLKAVKQWLEPLPDKSLPAVGIQKAIFEVLPKMDLDTPTIREAGLGPIILFYTKTKRVSPALSRQADALVQVWSRPIIKRPADFRSRHISRANEIEMAGGDENEDETMYDEEADASRPRPASKGSSKPRRFDARKAMAENEGRRGARPMVANEVQYTIAPESRTQHQQEDLQHVSRIQMDNRKFNRFARQLKGGAGRR